MQCQCHRSSMAQAPSRYQGIHGRPDDQCRQQAPYNSLHMQRLVLWQPKYVHSCCTGIVCGKHIFPNGEARAYIQHLTTAARQQARAYTLPFVQRHTRQSAAAHTTPGCPPGSVDSCDLHTHCCACVLICGSHKPSLKRGPPLIWVHVHVWLLRGHRAGHKAGSMACRQRQQLGGTQHAGLWRHLQAHALPRL